MLKLLIVKEIKDLNKIVFEVTRLSPKEYKYDLISNIRNTSIDLLEEINNANRVYINSYYLKTCDRLKFSDTSTPIKEFANFLIEFKKICERSSMLDERLQHLRKVELNLEKLDMLIATALEIKAITIRQSERISEKINSVSKLLNKIISMNSQILK